MPASLKLSDGLKPRSGASAFPASHDAGLIEAEQREGLVEVPGMAFPASHDAGLIEARFRARGISCRTHFRHRTMPAKRQMYGRAGFELLRARVLPYTPALVAGPAP